VAVANDLGMAAVIAAGPVSFQVGVDLSLERNGEHPLAAAAADLIQGEGELLASVVLSGYPEHRRTSFRRRFYAGNSDQ
jgi:hypothetical protein